MRGDPLMLRRHPIAAGELPPAGNSKPGGLLYFDPRQGLCTEIRQMERVYLQSLDTYE